MMDNINNNSNGDIDMTNLAVFGGMDINENQLPTPASFSKRIERLALDNNLTHIESCLYWCDENGLEPEDVSHLINASLRDKIRYEAEQKNFLKKQNALPI